MTTDHRPMSDPAPQRRLAEILDIVIDGQASDADQRELNSLLMQHPELAPELAAQLRMHNWLQWESPEIKATFSDAARVVPFTATHERRPRGRWLAAACAAFAAVGVWYVLANHGATPDDIAEIVDERLVAWSADTDAVTPERRIRTGRLSIDSGTLTLRFRSGATLKAIGPASLRVKSDMLVHLDEGQATAHVPHWARGFTIETPAAEIIDLGTEFGVAARRNGQTDVIVFDGEVDLTPLPRRSSAAAQKRLIKGEAVTITKQGGIDRIVQVQRDDRGENWSTTPLPDGNCMFAEIYDNLRATGSAMCYQITPGGLAEDALAFVDRPHQWNGLGDAGLPDFLQHADYVRTFNEDKYMGELEIVVKLAQPSWLYLMVDDRVPLPPWVEDEFDDTGVNIGLDEGPWPAADMTLATAIGSGNSVDHVFSVWRKSCENELTVRLGSLGLSPEARAMYGIAATPLD